MAYYQPEEIRKANHGKILHSLRNDGFIICKQGKCFMRKEKHCTPKQKCNHHSDTKSSAYNPFDASGISFSPILGSKNDNTFSNPHCQHLQKKLNLIHESHTGKCGLLVGSQHDIVRKAHTEDHQIL